MMKYAVISLQGQQHKVSEGDEILVDKLTGKPKVEVLMVVVGGKAIIGKPSVSGASVKLKIVSGEEKGKKLTVSKYKAKSRYRKKLGFRHLYSRLLIEKIKL